MHEADEPGEQAVDGEPGEDEGPPPDAVGQRAGELQGDDVADGEGGQGQPRHRRAVDEGGCGVEGDDGDADAEVGPAVGEAGHQGGAVGGVAPGLAEAHDGGGAHGHLLPQGFGVEADGDDEGRHDQGKSVDVEGRAHAPGGHGGAEERTEDVAEQERGPVGGGAFAADVRWRQADDEAHGGDGEHGGADAAECAERQQGPVVPGGGDEQGGYGDDAQAREVGAAVSGFVDEPPGRRREDESEDGKGADHEAGGEDGDVEAAGVLGQDGSDEAEAEGDDERRADQHPDFVWDRGFRAARGSGAATVLLHVSTIDPGSIRLVFA